MKEFNKFHREPVKIKFKNKLINLRKKLMRMK